MHDVEQQSNNNNAASSKVDTREEAVVTIPSPNPHAPEVQTDPHAYCSSVTQPTANGGAIEASAVAFPLPDVVALPQSTHPTANAVEQLNCWPKETLSYDQSRSIGTGTMGSVYLT
ncbi:hypothetical protein Pelo_19490 [Pelomyxa schiedti]|nr:hypothetical protein Pelo_19490 [Pelomyxa schiedti]